ncbi:CvpA family protein [Lactobacillaceae bacterium Melli_B4]
MLTIIILVLMGFSIIVGWRRGFVAGLVSLGNYLISFWIAWHFSHGLSKLLISALSNIDQSLLNGIGFFITFFISYLVLNHVSRIFKTMAKLPVLRQLNGILGALVGFLMGYFLIFIALTILVKANQPWFVQYYPHDHLAQMIVNQTPIMTREVVDRWLNAN